MDSSNTPAANNGRSASNGSRLSNNTTTSSDEGDSNVSNNAPSTAPTGSALTGPPITGPGIRKTSTVSTIGGGTGGSTSAGPASSIAPTTTTFNSSDTATTYSLPQPASSSYLLEDARLREILMSDVGTEALLKRLKQSIHAAKELSSFLKKSSNLENEHMGQVRKLASSAISEFAKPEYRQGTFAGQLNQLIKVNERSCDAARSFTTALVTMQKELANLSATVDKSRKSIKESALRHERQLLEAEQQAEKAKSKYDSLAEEFDKVRTGDPTKNKFGFMHSKGAQHEEELHKKVQTAESDYKQKVENAQRLRSEQINKNRPAAIKQLKDLILECDSAMSFQLQKYANLHEILALNRGFIVAPLKPNGAANGNLTMKEMAAKIDNELDLYNYVIGVPKTVSRLNRPLVQFQRHSTLAGAYPTGSIGNTTSSVPQSFQNNTTSPPPPISKAPGAGIGGTVGAGIGAGVGAGAGLAAGLASGPNGPGSAGAGAGAPTAPAALNSHTAIGPSPVLPPVATSEPFSVYPGNDTISPSSTIETQAVSTTASNFDTSAGPVPTVGQPGSGYPPGTVHSRPSFGTPLDVLLDYEEATVPRVVFQCIQAVDNFGLEVEGIYRTSGNNNQVQEIKRLFDLDAASVDLLHPTHGLNDIHSVAGALKLYFRELPDPLLTGQFHDEFVAAAKLPAGDERRDGVHRIVNELPDPNYTTLRHLIFHLYRVQTREASNRMSISNLAIVWGPTLMSSSLNNPEDMALEASVIETILVNAYTIFDAD
ncbi:Rgd1p [Sugiyamaella lignohabitans]|uniref:Rgd1p n=1 Tax=Sugiyamaella lignohabitans TaxID=796027 RepID=A0A167EDA6_9ASCO|nr:Rgd1p [Sugiyamaella lignohabitans]ANB13929.1 Rgd1p [Sugiyamaella lignohabitans]